MSVIIKAKCVREMFRNGDYRILGWSPCGEYEGVRVSNYFTFGTKGNDTYIVVGKEYDLELEEVSFDPKFGGTYKIISCPSSFELDLQNLSREQSFEILMDCTSSERIAENILDAYPNFIQKILTEGKESIDLKLIKGVGESYLNAYARQLEDIYKWYGMVQGFKEYKIDAKDCKNLVDYYGDEAKVKEAFDKDPYQVMHCILNKSFESIDKIILEAKPQYRESFERCACLVLSVIEKNESNGDSKIDASDLYYYIIEEYTSAKELEPFIVPCVTESELFHYDKETQEVSSMSTYLAECKIANFVKDRIENSTKLDFNWQDYRECRDGFLTDEQSNILKTFCESNFVVVDSRGGTGKSASTLALIQMLEDKGMSYSLLAPTGRVAKVLKELTNGRRPTSTIHRAYYRNLNEGLWSDVVIVEEGSMIGIDLMCMLVDLIHENPNVRVLFNMDLGQIAPISCGCPMRDIIKSGLVPICRLTKIFRYGEGGLYKMASDAYDKVFYLPNGWETQDRISVGEKSDYTYARFDGTVEQILKEYQRFLDKGIKSEDIAVITPYNVTEFGTINLNNKIQEIVNPSFKKKEEVVEKKIRGINVKFKVNDLILNTKNNYEVLTLEGYNTLKYDKEEGEGILTENDVEHSMCMNGEVGKIVKIENGNIIAKFDEEFLIFDKKMQDDLMLAYSLTSYKLQGSSVPYVISLITPQFTKSLNKNIIYTDMSRTKKEIVEIIDPTVLANTITIDTIEDRRTNLLKILLEE